MSAVNAHAPPPQDEHPADQGLLRRGVGSLLLCLLVALSAWSVWPLLSGLLSGKKYVLEAPLHIYTGMTHNVVQFRQRLYIIPHALKDVDFPSLSVELPPGVDTADTIEEAKALVLQREREREFNAPPKLMDTVGEVNVVKFRGRFFAIPQKLGPLDLGSLGLDASDSSLPAGVAVYGSLEQAREHAQRLLAEMLASRPPSLQEDAGWANIVAYRGAFWLLDHALGPVDVAASVDAGGVGLPRFETLEDARRAAKEEALAREALLPPRLVASTSTCNVVAFQGRFFVVPKKLGQVDLNNVEVRESNGIKPFATQDDALGCSDCR